MIAAWVVHTHAVLAADTTPYLAVTSAEKQWGKTRLLETLDVLVHRPWYTGRATAAVLVRKIDMHKPTLLLDESDAAFKGDQEYAETLRGVLNTGHRRGGKPLHPVGLARLLKPFAICPRTIRVDGATPKGYLRDSFLDAWKRYLPQRELAGALDPDTNPQHPPQSAIHADAARTFEPQPTSAVAWSEIGKYQ